MQTARRAVSAVSCFEAGAGRTQPSAPAGFARHVGIRALPFPPPSDADDARTRGCSCMRTAWPCVLPPRAAGHHLHAALHGTTQSGIHVHDMDSPVAGKRSGAAHGPVSSARHKRIHGTSRRHRLAIFCRVRRELQASALSRVVAMVVLRAARSWLPGWLSCLRGAISFWLSPRRCFRFRFSCFSRRFGGVKFALER